MNRVVSLITSGVFFLQGLALAAETGREENMVPREVVARFGESAGSFRRLGEVAVSSDAVEIFLDRIKERIPEAAAMTVDPAGSFRAEFFVNGEGKGYGVLRGSGGKALPRLPEMAAGKGLELRHAVELLIWDSDPKLLDLLLGAGLPVNGPIDPEEGVTLLHRAVISSEPWMVRRLIEAGAERTVRDKWGSRPIDYALKEKEREALAGLLRLPETEEKMIGGYPEAMLAEVFDRPGGDRARLRFISINGKDPEDALMKYFRTLWPNLRPRSGMVEVQEVREADGMTLIHYRDGKAGAYGDLVELLLEKKGERAIAWSHREASGPSMAGGGSRGRAVRDYGYWLRGGESSWDE